MDVQLQNEHNVHCVFVFSQGNFYWKKAEKKAHRVIITVLRAHRGYASFNFTLYSPFPLPPPSLSLSLPVILWGSTDSRGMIEEGLLEQGGKWSANGTLTPIGHLLTFRSPAAHSVGICTWVCVCVCVCVCVWGRGSVLHFHFLLSHPNNPSSLTCFTPPLTLFDFYSSTLPLPSSFFSLSSVTSYRKSPVCKFFRAHQIILSLIEIIHTWLLHQWW